MYKCDGCGKLTEGAKGNFNWSIDRNATVGACNECHRRGEWFLCTSCLRANPVEARVYARICLDCVRNGGRRAA
jgi:hypothetical protein